MLQVKSPKAFNQRIYSLIKDAMDIKGDLTVAPIDEAAQVYLTLLLLALDMSDCPCTLIYAPRCVLRVITIVRMGVDCMDAHNICTHRDQLWYTDLAWGKLLLMC